MEVILYQPRIPQNTGNIVPSCKVTNSSLTLVKPLGFSTSDGALKRAGLDYRNGVDVTLVDDPVELLSNTSRCFYFFSSHATKAYTEVSYGPTDLLVFGSETGGLSPVFLEK